MIVVFEVQTTADDGSAVLARTTLALDGSVITAVRPELLDSPALLSRHYAEVEGKLRRWLGRLARVERGLTVAQWSAVVVAAGSGIASAGHAYLGLLHEAAGWAVGVLVGALARWLLPIAVRRVVQRRFR